MKTFLANIFRSLAFAQAFLCIGVAVLTVEYMVTHGQWLLCLVTLLALFLFHFMFSTIAKIHAAYVDIDSLDEAYPDVKHFTKGHIILLLALLIGFTAMAIVTNIYNPTKYAETYPDAEKTLMEDFNATQSALLVYKVMPPWLVEPTWISAQAIHDGEVALENDKEDTETLDAIADKLDADMKEVRSRAYLGMLSLLAWGVVYNLSYRSRQYIEQRKKMKGK